MMEDPVACREKAEVERSAATAATLAQVRARHLHAAASWDRMAERGESYLKSKARKLETTA